MKKIFTLTILFVYTAFGQSDAASAEYFKAQANLGAAKLSHEQLLDNIKKALQDSTDRHTAATVALNDKLTALRLTCPQGKDLDFTALNEGKVSCVEPAKK